MDIGSGKAYPANKLSNFSPNHFIFQGVECHSMEGLLQSFKFDKIPIQEEVCKLVGKAAKFRGKKKNWQTSQTLWWKGKPYLRDSNAYQGLLMEAYKVMFDQCEGFRNALKASGNSTLTHSIGRNKESETILTQREFCRILTTLRDTL